jgi:hypothetical protein
MSWAALEAGAPELARAGRERFERTRVALLGTIREEGAPRISPVEPFLLRGQLVFGVMASPKWNDLRRDPRIVLHSSISDVNGSEGEFKVYGHVVPTDDPAILDEPTAWWASSSRAGHAVFAVEIAEVVLVSWDPDQERMRTSRWSAGAGAREATRTYP